MYEGHNAELLALVPADATRIVEVGCGSGAFGREYLKCNPDCEYIGIELEPEYADVARVWCSRVIVGNIEHMPEEVFKSLFPASCWVFGDVLEHLQDPWSVLRRVRQFLSTTSCVIACIPNAQHWSVQVRLNCGAFRYEDYGLLDRTHLRWFTRKTAEELFHTSGFDVVEAGGRIVPQQHTEQGLAAVKAMAQASGADVEQAIDDAIPIQWIIRAAPSLSQL